MENSVKIPLMQYFRTGYLCRRRHKVALIAEQNLTFCSRSFDTMRLRNGGNYMNWRKWMAAAMAAAVVISGTGAGAAPQKADAKAVITLPVKVGKTVSPMITATKKKKAVWKVKKGGKYIKLTRAKKNPCRVKGIAVGTAVIVGKVGKKQYKFKIKVKAATQATPKPAVTTSPTAKPTVKPTVAPTAAPTVAPTTAPTAVPTPAPVVTPTPNPEENPVKAELQISEDGLTVEDVLNPETATYVEFPSTVTEIGSKAFDDCTYLWNITIPKTITDIDKAAFLNSNVVKFTVEEGNPVYDSRNDCGAIMETATNTLWIGSQSAVIPGNTEAIGYYAFYGVNRGQDSETDAPIVIPASVKSIGSQSFAKSSISGISVDPANTVYDSRNNCQGIMETATNTLIFGNENTVIPADTLAIGPSAFRHSGVVNVVLPESVRAIGDRAFYHCTNLESIYIPAAVLGDNLGEELFGAGDSDYPALRSITHGTTTYSSVEEFEDSLNWN